MLPPHLVAGNSYPHLATNLRRSSRPTVGEVTLGEKRAPFISHVEVQVSNALVRHALKTATKALEDVRELLEDGLLQEAEVLAIWKAVPKADATGDRVDFVGFREAFARVDALFEEEEEEEEEEIPAESAEAGVGVGGGQGARGEAVAGGAGETEASFFELVGSTEGVLDLNGLLR